MKPLRLQKEWRNPDGGTYPLPLSVKGVATNDFGSVQRFIAGKLQKWHNERLTTSVKANTSFTPDEVPSLAEGMGALLVKRMGATAVIAVCVCGIFLQGCGNQLIISTDFQ